MSGLPNELYHRCRNILLQCGEFDSNASLRAVFVTRELSSFRGGLPEAASKSERVDKCLDFLLPKRLSGGRPLLPLFLAVLRDRYPPGDALREDLEVLSEAVQSAMVQPKARSSQGPLRAKLEWDTGTIRDLLTVAFGDEELDIVCYDHFRPVYEQFTSGMSKLQKVHRLVEHCERHRSLDQLLMLVRERNPAQFAHFEARLGIG